MQLRISVVFCLQLLLKHLHHFILQLNFPLKFLNMSPEDLSILEMLHGGIACPQWRNNGICSLRQSVGYEHETKEPMRNDTKQKEPCARADPSQSAHIFKWFGSELHGLETSWCLDQAAYLVWVNMLIWLEVPPCVCHGCKVCKFTIAGLIETRCFHGFFRSGTSNEVHFGKRVSRMKPLQFRTKLHVSRMVFLIKEQEAGTRCDGKEDWHFTWVAWCIFTQHLSQFHFIEALLLREVKEFHFCRGLILQALHVAG